jgi:hypothetical protein
MATYDEVLAALKLWPVWRGRADFWSPSSSPVDEARVETADFTAVEDQPDNAIRRSRIATLTWRISRPMSMRASHAVFAVS